MAALSRYPTLCSAQQGGFPSVRHNEIRDLIGDLLGEVCHDVAVEPSLQPITSERFFHRSASTDNDARVDIAASGFFGGRFERTFFYVRVFNPFAPSNQGSLKAVYRRHELEKRRKYGQRIREVEHASFTPVVFSSAGGAGPAASVVLKRLAGMIADRRDVPYHLTMSWLRTRLSFALLRSSVMSIRGARSSRQSLGRSIASACIELAVAESSSARGKH